jgi:hypothetical protein
MPEDSIFFFQPFHKIFGLWNKSKLEDFNISENNMMIRVEDAKVLLLG